jgi:hypothetical protein
MMDNDFNAIKPVENLQNVTGLTPTGQRQERKRRPNPPRRGQGPDGTPPDEAAEKEASDRDRDSHTIDYCA